MNTRNTKFQFEVNQLVQTATYNYIGRILKCYQRCPMKKDWIDNQSVPIKPESLNKPWYDILVLPAGGICVPEYDIEELEEQEPEEPELICYRCKDKFVDIGFHGIGFVQDKMHCSECMYHINKYGEE